MITVRLTGLVLLTAVGALPSSATAQDARADTTVRIARQPVHPGVATLVEELSIGVADGAEEYMIGEIADIAVAADGSIYAYDRQASVIRYYDAQGRFIRSIGRRGQGPGEFRSVSGLALHNDGRLLVWDTGNWRINVYSASGDVLTHWLTPSGSSGSSNATYARAIMVDRSGTIITRKVIFDVRDIRNRPTVWLRFRSDGTPLDTLVAPSFGGTVPELSATSGNAQVTREVPFSPKRAVVLSPAGYFIAGFPNRYAFEVHRPGQPVLSVRRDVRAEPVSRTERAEARREVEERLRRTEPTWSWNGPDIPATKPHYADLHVGLDGRIWVALIPEVSARVGATSSGGGIGPPSGRPRPAGPPAPAPRPALYDVFEPDGVYLGQVQVPAKVSSVVRQGDRIWAVAYDADDVPRIKRFRIAWGK